jgi:hypothetical protein
VTPVQGLWVEGPLSELERLSIRSFLAHGHEYRLFSYGEVPNLPAGAQLLPAAEVLPACSIFRYDEALGGSYAAFANVFRYKLLHDRGGWWADTDMVCLRPLDSPDPWVLASEARREGGAVTTNAILKAPAGAPMLADCFERAMRHEQRATVWGATGPALLDEAVDRWGLTRFRQPPETFCPVDWWRAADLLEPLDLPAGASTVHLWNEIWRWQGWPREPRRWPGSLYRSLHDRYPGD